MQWTSVVCFIPTKYRHRSRKGGKTYDDKRNTEQQMRIRQAYNGPMFEGPVSLSVDTHAMLPKSKLRMVKEPNTYKPDADNTAKLIMDALNGVAWRDDSQVVELNVIKADRSKCEFPWTRFTVSEVRND